MELRNRGGMLAILILAAWFIQGCSTTRAPVMKRDSQLDFKQQSGDVRNRGYKYEEASQFVEFCVELDSQDDRLPSSQSATHDPSSMHFHPQIDPALWNPKPVYDSRVEVAKDVIAFRADPNNPKYKGWAKLYREVLEHAAKAPPAAMTAEALAADPRYNGFGPYQSAWVLYEGAGKNAGAYAIAIRGTVFSAQPSVVEDVLFHPVMAQGFLNPNVSFASFPGASLHSGFAHATFTLLLDERYGILQALNKSPIRPGARLYIVGHSQGASMATLTHAFFHYAMKHANADDDVFDLRSRDFKLKSYVFAQPKPGNFEFAADFASITQQFDNAIVINNDIDPVPQVPLTMQDLGDLDGDLPGTALWARFFHFVAGIGSGLRGTLGRVSEPFVKDADSGYGYFYNYPKLGSIGKDKTGASWNFTAAGHLLTVYGNASDTTDADAFVQHHAWTYRDLIRAQLRD